MGKKHKHKKKEGANGKAASPLPPPPSSAPVESRYSPLLHTNLKLSKTFEDRGVHNSSLVQCIGEVDHQQDVLIASQSCGVFQGDDNLEIGEK
jgi:hypothetical protein